MNRKSYRVKIAGITHVLLLTQEAARRYADAELVDAPKQPDTDEKARETVPNKGRRPTNKGRRK